MAGARPEGQEVAAARPLASPLTWIVLALFALGAHLQALLVRIPSYLALYERHPFWVPEGVKSLLQAALAFLAVALLYRLGPRAAARELGLAAPPLPGLVFGLVASAPLLVGLAVLGRPFALPDLPRLAYLALLGPFVEELLFRGFAFRQLERRAGWGLWPAAALTAVVVAAGQVTPGVPWPRLAAGVALTFAATALFCWLLVRWHGNLWAPFALHAAMNLWWAVFVTTGLGGPYALALQVATALGAILLTLAWAERARPR